MRVQNAITLWLTALATLLCVSAGRAQTVSINCGGAAASPYIADADYSGGATASVTNSINTSSLTGTAPPQAVLQSNRYGTFTYTVPGFTAGASCTVTLYFAEEYWTASGKRVFDVTINGTQVLTNFDIYAAAGAEYKAVQKSFTTTANSSGQVVIVTKNVTDQAQINGIVVAASASAPAAPAGLTAASGNSQVTLSWTASTGATSYNVYRGTTAGGESTTAIATGLTGTTYTNTGLTNGTTYYYKVAAVNAAGTSALSNEASATPAGSTAVLDINCGGSAASPYVADVDYSGGSTTSVTNTISTTQLSGAVPPQAVLQSNRYGAFTYTLPGLTAGASYTVTLYFAEAYWTASGKRVFNVAINGTQVLTNFDIYATAGGEYVAVQKSFTATANSSGQIVITTTNVTDNAQINGIAVTGGSGGSGGAPAAPANLVGTAGNAQASLTWTASSGATSYNVYMNGSLKTSGVTGTSATVTGLTNGTAYNFTVAAVSAGGTSAMSNQVTVTPTAGTTVPAAPTSLAAVGGNALVSLSWNASTSATSYNVYRGTTSGGESSTALATGVTSTSYTDSSAANGTTYYYTVKAVNSAGTSAASNEATATPTAGTSGAPNFGPNVYVFTPSMSMSSIQSTINSIYTAQQTNQFGSSRYALLFTPGTYSLDIPVGFYTQVLGLGSTPDSTTINGYVKVDASWNGGNATTNFWRGAENLAVNPSDSGGTDEWAVSQACPWRRMHIKGNAVFADESVNPPGWASGGFLGDSLIDGAAQPISQQQWLSRNSQWASWSNGVWNMVFVGCVNAPATSWPSPPYTDVATTPVIREKPYLTVDSSGNYSVFVPSLRTNSTGTSWSGGSTAGTSIPISQFYIAHAGTDNASSINAALNQGLNILFTPGIYPLSGTINVNRAGTVLLGLGLATLQANGGQTAISVADVDGVTIAGLLVEPTSTVGTLIQVGPTGSSSSHASNPTLLADLFTRIGGSVNGQVTSSVVINSNNVIGDDFWLWRADHGNSGTVGWTTNTAANGLVVNGNNVTIYGLANEHFQQYQTLWNGNGGSVYFYQSEDPYDVPAESSWMDGSIGGYASYKVANTVTSHQAYGVGVYCYFNVNPSGVYQQNAIEAPTSGSTFTDMVIVSLGGEGTIDTIINGTGGPVTNNNGTTNETSYLAHYP